MIKCALTEDQALIKSVLTNPTLWKILYGQGTKQDDFKVDMSFQYLAVSNDDEFLGLFQVRSLTKMLLECHSYVLPKYWGTKYSRMAVDAGFNWVKKNTTYLKCFTDIPDDCQEVIKASEQIGWKKIGTVKKGVIYNGRLQNLYFYEYDLKR